MTRLVELVAYGRTETAVSDRVIVHGYTGAGVESEALYPLGRVVRVGLDPGQTAPGEPVRGDMTEWPVDPAEVDLACLHPPCARWSALSRSAGTQSDHPDLIADARRFGQRCGDYIIENVPQAPLDDPVHLEGRMFGLPIVWERAFETSFPVDPPPKQHTLSVAAGGYKSDNLVVPGRYTAGMDVYRAVKGYTRDYTVNPFKRDAVPRPYIDYLLRAYLRADLEE